MVMIDCLTESADAYATGHGSCLHLHAADRNLVFDHFHCLDLASILTGRFLTATALLFLYLAFLVTFKVSEVWGIIASTEVPAIFE